VKNSNLNYEQIKENYNELNDYYQVRGINIEKEVTEIEIKLDWKNQRIALIPYVCWIYLVFIEKGENIKFVLGIIIFILLVFKLQTRR